MPSDLAQRLPAVAQQDGRSVSDVLNLAAAHHVNGAEEQRMADAIETLRGAGFHDEAAKLAAAIEQDGGTPQTMDERIRAGVQRTSRQDAIAQRLFGAQKGDGDE